jgi:surfeit locus 1 family protein
MLRDLLRPKALISHLLVASVAVVCVVLGNWQLSRLAEVRANNALLAERLESPALGLDELAGPDTGPIDERALEFRAVTVSGTYRHDEEVLQRNRGHQGQQGFHVLTPFELEGGQVLLVRRGWVPSTLSEPPVTEAAPPGGTVTITGVLERPVPQPSFGARDPDDGELDRVFHTDTQRLDRQIDGELFPMVLRLETQDPPLGDAPDDLPRAIGRPELDEANHLSYALQWFSFAAIALITYGAWLWKRSRRPTDERSGAPAREDRSEPELRV